MLLYSLRVTRAIKHREHMISCFIDLEGAFDKVWRNGIIYKLKEAGLSGRLLLFIASYLEDRKVRNKVKSFTSDWICSDIGVPQGSVLGPILFIFFIKEMMSNIGPHISFADDLTLSHSNVDINVCIINTERDLIVIFTWCHKWRMVISIPKTDIMVHSHINNLKPKVMLNGRALQIMDRKRCLGIVLDPNLTFKDHVDHVCGVTLSALNGLSALFYGCTIEMALHLYKCLVRTHLERMYPIWCQAKNAIPRVEKIQRQALLRATGAFVSVPSSALEVISKIQPLRLRLQEVLIMNYTKIYSMKGDDPLKVLISNLQEDEIFMDHRVLTPLHILKIALRDCPVMQFIKDVEPQTDPSMKRLTSALPSVHGLEEKMGSSGNRTKAQADAAKEATKEMINRLPSREPKVFTDGSALTNPGPCGGAAVCYTQGMMSEPIVLKSPVSFFSTSYHGELVGLRLATEFLELHTTHNPSPEVHVFSDCRAAISSISSIACHSSHQKLIDDIQTDITALKERGTVTNIHWVPGHVDLVPNELADKAAKAAAMEARQDNVSTTISLQTVKGKIRLYTRERWQKIWNTSDTGRNVHDHFPVIPTGRFISVCGRNPEVKYLRLITGHHRLKNHLHKLNLSETPCCDCSDERETPAHVMLHCPLYTHERATLVDHIELVYVKHETPFWERSMDINTMLFPCHQSKQTRWEITCAVMDFLKNTELKI
jgi:ribonuclease HI